ncbi:uncharacterized protein LOC135712627 [Ochlerotatus camptorhynchus]|uniref:uncharacterized protein LOC135712627 n=1 Tax=Ochlerotatus camptorhynchus TaxID=644619 RepID=UPI0031DC6950
MNQLMVHLTVVVLVASVVRASDADFRVFDFGDEDTEFFSSYEKAFNDHEYFPSDLNLGALDFIAATPNFAKHSSYVDPSEVEVARSKRKAAAASSEEHSGEDGEGPDDYVDRYERFVSRHFQDRDQQRKEDDAKGDGAGYQYRFDYSPSDDYERIKQESEAQSRQLAKDPKNCKAFEQDGMLCHVCRDPATDTTSESCAYATVPHHKKFAYVKQKNYNSRDHEKEPEKEEDEADVEGDDDDDDDGEDEIEETTKAPVATVKQRTRAENISNLPQQKPKVIPTKKSVVHVKPGQAAINGGGYRYQPVDMRSNKQRPAAAGPVQTIQPTYYDFYTHFFPASAAPSHGSVGRSQKIQQQAPANSDDVYVLSYRDKDQVAKVLADFESRDWSNCKKGKKNELTCYTCTDKDGVKHEECMYLSESRQVSSRVLPSSSPVASPAPATQQPSDSKPTKKPRRKKVQPEKKPTSPKLRKQSGKLVAANDPNDESGEQAVTAASNKGHERQTVKRTVSIKSHVDDSSALDPWLDGERVVHYEHHVSHRL